MSDAVRLPSVTPTVSDNAQARLAISSRISSVRVLWARSRRVVERIECPNELEGSPAAKDAVLQNAAALQPLFTKIEVTWDDLGQTAAAQYARDGRAFAAEVEKAASEGNWDAVKANATSLNAVCGQCHGAYRDRMDDGTFRFRVGSF